MVFPCSTANRIFAIRKGVCYFGTKTKSGRYEYSQNPESPSIHTFLGDGTSLYEFTGIVTRVLLTRVFGGDVDGLIFK